MEFTGVPIDLPALEILRENWTNITNHLIDLVDQDFHVYEDGSFSQAAFEYYVAKNDLPWPRLASGRVSFDDDTFRDMARIYPAIKPLKDLRATLSDMRLSKLPVGRDGRNRTPLWPFSSRTGRNQPSNSKFIFGPAAWMRALIKPEPEFGLAYFDWEQQEIAIAARRSGDLAMQADYQSGDMYLAFGKKAGLIPQDATKASHGEQRECFKQCLLGIGYGLKERGLALKIKRSRFYARELIEAHRRAYPVHFRWSEQNVLQASLGALIQRPQESVFRWPVHYGAGSCSNSEDGKFKPNAAMNFPMQSDGAEMMRIACCLAFEGGITLLALVHDALLIQAPLDRLEADAERMGEIMVEASRIVLDGFKSASKPSSSGTRIEFPIRREKGAAHVEKIWGIVEALGEKRRCA